MMTSTHKFGVRAINPHMVLKTWNNVLLDRQNLPDDWTRQTGVLVGIGTLWPPGQTR